MAAWGGTTQQISWTTWKAGGCDAHSVVADPLFTDTNKTWPNYQPKGDYTVKAGSPALALGFKNFPMDSFGVMGTAGPQPVAVQSPYVNGRYGQENVHGIVKYSAGVLNVLQTGEYRVTITNASGRTVAVVNGKDDSRFVINKKRTGSGLYIASVRSAAGVVIQKFLVN